LALLSALGVAWRPLLVALPLLGLATAALLLQATLSAARARFNNRDRPLETRLRLYGLTMLLYLLQPIARLRGRLAHRLTPWPRRGPSRAGRPWPRTFALWRPHGRSAPEHLTEIIQALREVGAVVRTGDGFDRWDFEVRFGVLGAVRVLMATEEHGAGRQLLRFRVQPWIPPMWLALVIVALATGAGAAVSQAWMAAVSLSVGAGLVMTRLLTDSGQALHAVRDVLDGAAAMARGHELNRAEAIARDRVLGEAGEEEPIQTWPAIERVA